MVKHKKNNNFKKDIFQKSPFRSTVYLYDYYDHVPSQEAFSYLDSAEWQSLSSLHWPIFPWIFTMWSSLPSSGLLDKLHLTNDWLTQTHFVAKTGLSDANNFPYIQSWTFLSKCLLNAWRTVTGAKIHKKYMRSVIKEL